MNIINDNFHMDMDMACHCLDPDRFFCCELGTSYIREPGWEKDYEEAVKFLEAFSEKKDEKQRLSEYLEQLAKML